MLIKFGIIVKNHKWDKHLAWLLSKVPNTINTRANHIEDWRKWFTFYRWHFQMLFHEWKP